MVWGEAQRPGQCGQRCRAVAIVPRPAPALAGAGRGEAAARLLLRPHAVGSSLLTMSLGKVQSAGWTDAAPAMPRWRPLPGSCRGGRLQQREKARGRGAPSLMSSEGKWQLAPHRWAPPKLPQLAGGSLGGEQSLWAARPPHGVPTQLTGVTVPAASADLAHGVRASAGLRGAGPARDSPGSAGSSSPAPTRPPTAPGAGRGRAGPWGNTRWALLAPAPAPGDCSSAQRRNAAVGTSAEQAV